MKTKLTVSGLSLLLVAFATQVTLAQKPPEDGARPRPPRPPIPNPNPTPTPPPAAPVCPPPQVHYERDTGSYRSIGMDGRSGLSGRSGSSGITPSAQTIYATGSPIKLNLRGTDGDDGTDGTDGDDASCGYFSPHYDRLNYNIQQAKGGAGGDAGRGGNGGNGGNTTIYFTNIDHLKNVYIDATPGVAGSTGYSGRGGRGCGCSYYSWESDSYKTVTRVATDGLQKVSCVEPVRITHSCRPGDDGSNGYSFGSSGTNGSIGSVTLINSHQPLPAASTFAVLEITDAASRAVTLSRNIFETRSGIQAFLAPGSVVSNTYSAFARRAELPVQLVWKARLPITSFAGSTVRYELSADGHSANITPSSSWIEGRTNMVNGTQVFTVERAILERDVARLSSVISGNGRNTVLTINDDAGVTDLIDRAVIDIEAESKGVFSHERFKGTVPANLIRLENNKYTINLHSLWTIKNSQSKADGDLKKGKVVKIKVSVKRYVGNRSATYEVNLDKYKLTDGTAIKD